MKCKYCPYFWNDADFDEREENWTRCHYNWNDGYAPCEIDEEESELEEFIEDAFPSDDEIADMIEEMHQEHLKEN